MTAWFKLLGAVALIAAVQVPVPAWADACAGVKRELTYGRVALQDAKDKAGFLQSAAQFEAAARKAPDCAQAFFNMGLVYEKAGEYSKALAALKNYLRLAPKAPDAAAVETKIYELEYRGQQQTAARQSNDRIIAALRSGIWCLDVQYKAVGRACGQRRHNSGMALATVTVDTERFRMFIDWQNGSSFTYAGTIRGRDLRGKYSSGHSMEPSLNCANLLDFTGEVSADGTRITFKTRRILRLLNCQVQQLGDIEEKVFVRLP